MEISVEHLAGIIFGFCRSFCFQNVRSLTFTELHSMYAHRFWKEIIFVGVPLSFEKSARFCAPPCGRHHRFSAPKLFPAFETQSCLVMHDAAPSVSEQRDSLNISDDGGESPDENGKRKQRRCAIKTVSKWLRRKDSHRWCNAFSSVQVPNHIQCLSTGRARKSLRTYALSRRFHKVWTRARLCGGYRRDGRECTVVNGSTSGDGASRHLGRWLSMREQRKSICVVEFCH